jgi:hypothetical protein
MLEKLNNSKFDKWKVLGWIFLAVVAGIVILSYVYGG